MNSIRVVFLAVATLFSNCVFSQSFHADSTVAAAKELSKIKAELEQQYSRGTISPGFIQELMKYGLWPAAHKAIISLDKKSMDYQLLMARYLVLNNDFSAAESLVNAALQKQPQNEEAILLKAGLEIEAWRLANAAAICEKAIAKQPSERLELMLGRAKLFQKDYDNALEIARKLLAKNPRNAKAHLLEADVYFWNQQPELAEEPLKKSLEIDPFNADARFSYGYAIWRRIDATQLDAMAAQWELALAINPLHYQTHWHWGNGHTNLTYADYAQPNDEEVRNALKKADVEIAHNRVDSALAITRQVEKEFPSSVLPLMHRGSIYYMAYDMDRKTRLDSARHIFQQILERKRHYGPAHNGLSVVIKSKRIPYLNAFDSITYALNHTVITDSINFSRVFPDVTYYPGNTAKAMAWNQLYTAVVYFPFLSKQQRTFQIPPLHIDLAISMHASFFRTATTFDNRQWMDIRGVGSGAAAIEYVERGAFLERNVLLHEYVHLFHGTVLTDEENRKIRALYYNAMKENRTLDYYSQNNESEYFAQTYPAYFEPVKVHPLDFKSMNTTSDLQSKDPEMYRFLDVLVKKEKAYLGGDEKAMASNWAQVFLNLSSRAKRSNPALAASYLDTALSYDPQYLPVFLAYAALEKDKNDFIKADEWLNKARLRDSSYAPIYVEYALLEAAKAQGRPREEVNLQPQISYLKKAYELEKDFQESARVAMLIRELYKTNGMITEAIAAAEEYVKNGATVSTYLRDRRDDAIAFSAVLRASLGNKKAADVLGDLVSQKPQNFEYRNFYADALALNHRFADAIATLKEAQRILSASGNARADYNLRIAEFYIGLKEKDSAVFYLKPFLQKKERIASRDSLRFVRLLNDAGFTKEANEAFGKVIGKGSDYFMAEYYFTKANLLRTAGKPAESKQYYEKSLELNRYLLKAYEALVSYYESRGEKGKASEWKEKMERVLGS